MNTSSGDAGASSSNSAQGSNNAAQLVLRRLASAPLKVLAEALDRDDTAVCRIRSGEQRVTFHEALELINALDCKVVDKNAMCVRRERYEALAEIAQGAMSDPVTSRRLIFEDAA